MKFAFSFITILLPATLMGATFPALTRFVTRSLAELRERVAALYFINSLGAVVGCWVCDFWWVPSFGLELTVFAAAALNLIAGLIAVAMSRAVLEGSPTAITAPVPNANQSDEYFSFLDLKIAIIAIGVSGFVAMLYEVAWTRLLALALGSSTHAYSIMLMTFISGIAVGALLIARWKGLRRTLDAFGWAEVALAAAMLFSMFTYELLPYWFAQIAMLLSRRAESYPLYEMIQAFICFQSCSFRRFALGQRFPLASRIATAEVSQTGRIGRKNFRRQHDRHGPGRDCDRPLADAVARFGWDFRDWCYSECRCRRGDSLSSRLVRLQPGLDRKRSCGCHDVCLGWRMDCSKLPGSNPSRRGCGARAVQLERSRSIARGERPDRSTIIRIALGQRSL